MGPTFFYPLGVVPLLLLLLSGCAPVLDFGDDGSTSHGDASPADAAPDGPDAGDAGTADATVGDAGQTPLPPECLCPALCFRARDQEIRQLVATEQGVFFFQAGLKRLNGGRVEAVPLPASEHEELGEPRLRLIRGEAWISRYWSDAQGLRRPDVRSDLHRWDGARWESVAPIPVQPDADLVQSWSRPLVASMGDRVFGAWSALRGLYELRDGAWELVRDEAEPVRSLSASPSVLAVGYYGTGLEGRVEFLRAGGWTTPIASVYGRGFLAAGDLVVSGTEAYLPDGRVVEFPETLPLRAAGSFQGDPYVFTRDALVLLRDPSAPVQTPLESLPSAVGFGSDGRPWIGDFGLHSYHGPGRWRSRTLEVPAPFLGTVTDVAGTRDEQWYLPRAAPERVHLYRSSGGSNVESYVIPRVSSDPLLRSAFSSFHWYSGERFVVAYATVVEGDPLASLSAEVVLIDERRIEAVFPFPDARQVLVGGMGDSVWVSADEMLYRLVDGELSHERTFDNWVVALDPRPEGELWVTVGPAGSRHRFFHRLAGEWSQLPFPGGRLKPRILDPRMTAATSEGLHVVAADGRRARWDILTWRGSAWESGGIDHDSGLRLAHRGDRVIAYSPSLARWILDGDGWNADLRCANRGAFVDNAFWPEDAVEPWYLGSNGETIVPRELE